MAEKYKISEFLQNGAIILLPVILLILYNT